MTSLSFGPFDLIAPIASGGMSEVWRGRHRTANVPVAIKILTGKIVRMPGFREAFRFEARAMSGLSHPGIVHIYDYGESTPNTLEADHFGAGCPYLVMEYLEGHLGDGLAQGSWPALQEALLTMLDALAHAHAKGMVHRDLKPRNILVDADGRYRISDFGIAFEAGHYAAGVERMRAAGTPEYMAPEQCHGHWRDFGPWTDLYALGCVAYTLASGEPPFLGETAMATMLAKLDRELPSVEPRFEVPTGFDEWLQRMLQRSPRRRFQRAADAAWALRGLGSPGLDYEGGEGASLDISIDMDTAITGTFDALPDAGAPATRQLDAHYESAPTPELYANRATIPVDWRTLRGSSAPPILDAGLGLLALRRAPIVGREAVRDALWQTLRQVHTRGTPGIVLLQGPAGVGKSRVVEWLCERAHEVGAATALRAQHAPDPGPADGVASMVLRHLRCAGLALQELQARVQVLLSSQGGTDPHDWDALTAVLSPWEIGKPTVHFDSQLERHLVLLRHLEQMAQDRVVVLWLDDVQWGADTIEFVQTLQERGEGAFLVVMTARADLLATRPIEGPQIEGLIDADAVDVHSIGPLPAPKQSTLVRRLLGLEISLAQRVEERTKGNPRFAIQMVRDWVQRGALIASPGGFRLSPKASGELPASVDQVWQRRVERRLATCEDQDVQALELAAVLGREVSREEWTSLCRMAAVTPSPGLLSGLLPDRMIEVLDAKKPQGDWRFAHSAVRATLELNAHNAGRLVNHHLLCARMLRSQGEWGARLGRHLRAGGAVADALGPLQRSLDDHLRMGDRLAAEGILGEWRGALDALAVPMDDIRRATTRLFQSRIAGLDGDLETADDMAFEVEVKAQEQGWDELETAALSHRARVAYLSGQLGDAKRLTTRAIEQLDARGDLRRLADCHWLLGRIGRSLGDFPAARTALEHAESAFRALGLVVEAAECLLDLARIARQRDEHQSAKMLIESARTQLQRAGARASEAAAIHDLGEIARLEGSLEDAEAHYRQARVMFRAVGSAQSVYAELNLSAVLQARGAYEEARELLEGALATGLRQGRRVFVAAARIILLPCYAHQRDWTAWDLHLDLAKQALDETGYVELDLAHHAYVGAFIAADAGEPVRAISALRLAVRQWKALYRPEEVKAALARIADLETEP